jgi:hypothetical protein
MAIGQPNPNGKIFLAANFRECTRIRKELKDGVIGEQQLANSS